MTPPSPEQLLELSRAVGRQLAASRQTIATAESCTGGLIASTLTDVAGSSDYVVGGVVSYSNQVKQLLLGVRPDTLANARHRQSGDGGRDGARRPPPAAGRHRCLGHRHRRAREEQSPDKPVGLVYLHLSAAGREWGERHVWTYDRLGDNRTSVAAALTLVLRYLTES